ncbi:MAG TPA: FecR domain-containing protein [Pyrinomonadaceae bacterium]|nr:FecR domain-containing protein [Pyrinomonadaceae bacterium]
MRSIEKVLIAAFVGILLVSFAFGSVAVWDDDELEVANRVSRVSFIQGDARIRRDGSQEWENAVLSLPIVEGDEIATQHGARLEIQLNTYSHVRLDGNSFLKVTGLKDGAVALSLSEGVMTVRLTEFHKDTAFFEVDAPKTTIALQKSGMYRIDAGGADSSLVRITGTNGGEARIYGENSGFTLRNGRRASINIDGPLAGEWQTSDASRSIDEFDDWSLQRDAIIAKRLSESHYDQYYDRDIYGADELTGHGEWIYTRDYGQVWRPYATTIGRYANWSPYRYGHWRWVPPFGWTWVNDEPWGWATYHHGRWFHDRGHWYWSPYGRTRRTRSWWAPALVHVTIINNNVCWYPLHYSYAYFNYNYYLGGWGGPRHGNSGGGPRGPRGGHGGQTAGVTPGTGPTPSPGPGPGGTSPSALIDKEVKAEWYTVPPHEQIPSTGVVSTPLSLWGRDKKGIAAANPTDARIALTKPLRQSDPVRILPTYQELDGRIHTAIKAEMPATAVLATKVRTGAAVRNPEAGPMDTTLQTTKIFGDRTPVKPAPVPEADAPTRKTGAVTRLPVVTNSEPVRAEPSIRTVKPTPTAPIRVAPANPQETKPGADRSNTPIRQAPVVESTRKPREQTEQTPRSDPPPRTAPIRSEPVRTEQPRKSDQPAIRTQPPKSEPVKPPPPAERKGREPVN